ncbi:hypothetical protein TNCT_130851 [Trichonephila clavata]|uniref:Uncharacterized protein n=1 Tax=Trichonephila clavata TaxID=2740835 RepID=A0A8X6GF54_TRICU|nr:hypothetical protein TNCT_130851 [Trichonephila clavata]
MSRRAKNRVCVQQVRERKPRSVESNGEFFPTGTQDPINKVKASGGHKRLQDHTNPLLHFTDILIDAMVRG